MRAMPTMLIFHEEGEGEREDFFPSVSPRTRPLNGEERQARACQLKGERRGSEPPPRLSHLFFRFLFFIFSRKKCHRCSGVELQQSLQTESSYGWLFDQSLIFEIKQNQIF
jgi:hypothetical protein